MQQGISFALVFFGAIYMTSCTQQTRHVSLYSSPLCPLQEAQCEAQQEKIFYESEWLNPNWWCLFDDEQLENYITLALQNYPSLKAAEAKLNQMISVSQGVRSALFPHINLKGRVRYFHESETGNPIPPFSFTQYEMLTDFKYHIDIWHKYRNSWKASIGEVRAEMADLAYTRLIIALTVAHTYFDLQTAFSREMLARELVCNRQDVCALVEQRVAKGLDTELSFEQAKSDLAMAKIFLNEIEQAVALSQHALRALLSWEDGQIVELVPLRMFSFPMPTALPVDLIAHRPDIAAQRWRIESALKWIDVAKADFYPNIDLLGFFGYETIDIKKLFMNKSIYSTVGPALHLPIFQGGRLCANLGMRQHEYEKASYDYNTIILQAVREVLDGTTRLRKTAERFRDINSATEATKRIYDLTDDQFHHNVVSYLDVLASQVNWLGAQDTLLLTQGESLHAALDLIRSLGGGYHD